MMNSGGRRSGRVERIWPELRERRAELLERVAEPAGADLD